MDKIEQLRIQVEDLRETVDAYDERLGELEELADELREDLALSADLLSRVVKIESKLCQADMGSNQELRREVKEELEHLRDEVSFSFLPRVSERLEKEGE